MNDKHWTDDAPNSDTGTVVPAKSWGVIWHPKDGWALLAPGQQMENGDEMVPDEALALTACFIRLHRDEDFYNEMLEWMEEQAEGSQ